MEAAHAGGDTKEGTCDECDPPRHVKDLPRHRYRVHGVGADGEPRRPRQDTPPRAASSAKSKGPTRAALRNDLTVTFTFVAQVVAMRDPVCGQVALEQVPQIVAAWDSWAASSPAVRRTLTMAMAGAGPIGVVMAHLPIVLVVAAHHGPNREQLFAAAPDPAGDVDGAAGQVPYPDGPVASEYAQVDYSTNGI